MVVYLLQFTPYVHGPSVTFTEIALSLSFYAFFFFFLVDKLLYGCENT